MRTPGRSLLAGALAGCVYGGWAYLVNRHAGPEVAGLASFVQASYSFALTMSLTYLIELLIGGLGRSPPALAGVIAIAAALLFTVAFLLQWLAATPCIPATILPGWIIGTGYAAVYTLTIGRAGPRAE